MRCAIYRRVSTDEQAEKGFSLENQRLRLESFAISQGWSVIGDYVDDGFSAKDTNRPDFMRLMNNLDNIDIVLVYKLDRFTRSVKDLNEVLEVFNDRNVSFKSATESIDTSSATGRMILNMIGTAAQWERETISERVKDVLTKMREKGIFPTGKPPYGYSIDKDRRIMQIPEEVEIVRYIFKSALTNGQKQIAKQLREVGSKTYHGAEWYGSNVGRMLKNPFYCGYLNVENELVPIVNEGYEPIITLEEFNIVQKIMKKRLNNQARRKSDAIYPFSGIVVCPSCGRFLSGDRVRKKLASGEYKYYYYYKCAAHKNHLCVQKSIAVNKIDSAFSHFISNSFHTNDIQIDDGNDIKTSEKTLVTLEKKLSRLKELYIDGDIEKRDYKERSEELNRLIEKTKKDIESSLSSIDEGMIRSAIRNIGDTWTLLDEETKSSAVRSIFDKIHIDDDLNIVKYKLL